MVTRYVRDQDIIPNEIKKTRRSVANAQRPTGTEIRQTADTADFAKELSEQLEVELGPLPGQIQQALDDAADALADAGLARSDAASAIAQAQQAVADASDAIAEAQAAATAAAAAQTAANGKNTVVRSPSAATAAGSYKQGDQWWQFSGGNIVGLWLHDGTAWVAQALTNAIIATLDAGKITTGTLAADRIGALSITAAKIAAEAITTEKIAALTVTASKLAADSVIATKIAANAVTAEKINAGAVTTDKLSALAVTAEKIAAGAIIADKIAAGAITTGKLAATAIDGMVITGALIRTSATGQRLQLSSNGLVSYDAAGAITASLRPGIAGMEVVGGDISCRTGSGAGSACVSIGTQFNNASIRLFGGDSPADLNLRLAGVATNEPDGFASLYTTTGSLRVSGARNLTLVSPNDGMTQIFGGTIQLGSGASNTVRVVSDTVVEGSFSYLSDIAWKQAAAIGSPDGVRLAAGWTNRIVAGFWNGFNTRRKAGIVYGQAAVFNGSTFAALDVIGVLPPALRPLEPLPVIAHFTGYPAGVRRTDFVLIRPNGEIVPAVGSTDTQTQILFTFSYPN